MEGVTISAGTGNPFAGATAKDFEVVESQPLGNGSDNTIDGGEDPDYQDPGQGKGEMSNPTQEGGEQGTEPIVEKPQETQPTSQADSTAPAAGPELSINDAIAKFGKADLLKALGLDDYAMGVLDYYEAKGSIDDYVAIKSINFKDMPPDALLKYKLRRDNPTVSDAAIDFMVRKKLSSEYLITDDLDDEQRAIPMEVFSADMEKVRSEFIQEQAKFSAPVRQPEPTVDIEAERQALLADPIIKGVTDSKTITVGPKDSPLKLQVVPDKILPLLYDDDALDVALQVKDPSGKPTGKKDPAKALKFAAFIADPEAYDNALIAHGKTLGKKQEVDTLENLPKPDDNGTPLPQEKTMWDAFRNRAKHTQGGAY